MKVTRKQLRKHLRKLLKENNIYSSSDLTAKSDTDSQVVAIKGLHAPNIEAATKGFASYDLSSIPVFEVNNESLKSDLISFHGSGGTAAGDSGETIVSLVSAHLSSISPRIASIIKTENVNAAVPGFRIKEGNFPGVDVLGYLDDKGFSDRRINIDPGKLDFRNTFECISAKRSGSPVRTLISGARANIIERTFGDEAKFAIPLYLAIRWIIQNQNQQSAGVAALGLPSTTSTPVISMNSSPNDVISWLLANGITEIKYHISDLQLNTIPYLGKEDLQDEENQFLNKDQLNLKYPLLDGIFCQPGGEVTFNVGTRASTVASSLNKFNGKSKGFHQLAGLVIVGGISDLSEEGLGRTDDVVRENEPLAVADISSFTLQADEVFGNFTSKFDDLISSQTAEEAQTDFEEDLREALTNSVVEAASDEFKAAIVIMSALDTQLKSGSKFTQDDSALIDTSGSGATVSDLEMVKSKRQKLALAQRGKSGLKSGDLAQAVGAKKAEDVQTHGLYQENEIPSLGKEIAEYIKDHLDKSFKNAKKLFNKKKAAEERKTPFTGYSNALSAVDDWLDSTNLLIAYLALLSVKCMSQSHSPNKNLITKMQTIASDYQEEAEVELGVDGEAMGREPDQLLLKTHDPEKIDPDNSKYDPVYTAAMFNLDVNKITPGHAEYDQQMLSKIKLLSKGKYQFPGVDRGVFHESIQILIKEISFNDDQSDKIMTGLLGLNVMINAVSKALVEFEIKNTVNVQHNVQDIMKQLKSYKGSSSSFSSNDSPRRRTINPLLFKSSVTSQQSQANRFNENKIRNMIRESIFKLLKR